MKRLAAEAGLDDDAGGEVISRPAKRVAVELSTQTPGGAEASPAPERLIYVMTLHEDASNTWYMIPETVARETQIRVSDDDAEQEHVCSFYELFDAWCHDRYDNMVRGVEQCFLPYGFSRTWEKASEGERCKMVADLVEKNPDHVIGIARHWRDSNLGYASHILDASKEVTSAVFLCYAWH